MSIDSNRIEGQEAVGRAYRVARDAGMAGAGEPPAAIDDAIRAAARRAVKAGPVPAGKSWMRRWTPQLAVAATVILSVSVIFVAIEERPELAPPPVAEITQHKVIATPDANVARSAPSASATGAADSLRPREKQAPGARRDTAAANEPPPLTVQAERQRVEPPAALLKEKKEEQALAMNAPAAGIAAAPAPASPAPPTHAPLSPSAPPPTPTPQVIISQASPAAPPATTPTAASASPAPPRAAPAPVQESLATAASKVVAADAARTDALSGAAPAKPAAAVPVPAAATVSPPATTMAPGTASGAVVAQKYARETRAQEAGAARAFADAPSAAPAEGRVAKANEDDPADWLKRMRELRAQGKLKELREELARFNKRYPHVVLPKELQDLPPE